ncbi:glycosyltransferase [Tamlana agarivorans]|uniref:Glycosyltransferase n=1 Tax=Pseudotamlana agarivorans TaxID=481183 RepID=A0ACC5UCU4_9FLAO|nr:glycosyltransferase family 2 protein [Tamlana agarivorans]MBU2952157.1 glycosyltransferase [Tamlana agarivorans]
MLISIITINYNDVKGLERTMESVLSQTFQDFEYIVIDGGSHDDSKELIEKNQEHIDYWVSEPDSGIYNAMNKGIKKAKGEYLFFLNSGDDFTEKYALKKVVKHLNGEGFVYFNINKIDGKNFAIKRPPEKLTFKYLHSDLPPHQSTFIKKDLFDKYGGYDERLKIVADWKFLILALLKYNSSYKYVDAVYTNFYLGGISSLIANKPIMQKERQAVLDSEFQILMNDLSEFFEQERTLSNLRNSKKLKLLVKLGMLNEF